MKQLIYIKVYKGYLEARTVGINNEQQFPSNGLNHPRSLAGNFDDVEASFREAISVQPKSFFGLLKPKILIHLIPKMKGGYTPSELRFFREAATNCGISDVYLLDDKVGPQPDCELNDFRKLL